MNKPKILGLLLMGLPVIFYLVYFIFFRGQVVDKWYRLDNFVFESLGYSLPCLTLGALAWRWPLGGGMTAMILSIFLTISNAYWRVTSVTWNHPDFSFLKDIFVWTFPYIILLIGSIIMCIVGIKEHQQNAHTNPEKRKVNGKNASSIILLSLASFLAIAAMTFFSTITDIGFPVGLFQSYQIGLALSSPLIIIAALIK